ncbi:MAG: hypothetical protein KGI68_12375 [Alphaproteobacteria bacterium]|nr:hypothetical protein [Alphaproteobacteria bacterium]MDE1985002.1 hypothetical protein [Alphaproteobacteria bacterium]MDE2162346.1 hypothetical protein [Alphaproteobacteria bacterium]
MRIMRGVWPAVARAATLAAALVLFAGTAARADGDWVAAANADGTFHFQAPVQPTSQTSTSTDAGVPYTQTVYTAASGGLIVLAAYDVYQPSANYVDPKLVLKGFLDGLAAQPISSEDQPYSRGPNDVLPGLTASAKTDQLTCHLRIVVDGVHVYLLVACGRAGYDVTADIDRAMASFAITK